MAVLDKAYRRCNWLHGRPRLYVRPVQDVHTAVSAMACIQPHHLRSKLSDDCAQIESADGHDAGKLPKVGGAERMPGDELSVGAVHPKKWSVLRFRERLCLTRIFQDRFAVWTVLCFGVRLHQ